ncbi:MULTISPECIES: YckD family protein [unclassified Bacillus (in: firmicutes)]|uniref:YckD family protein n=1 Tax=unclassified Bacillus (in: firmicutes) TaxID=185979 RepID=UPI0008E34B1C|nr:MULTISPECIES: YckD family protein [unclassified Bacillus (in: firmicutes)]SFB24130.1 Protein of unknown function [Bacillus sp. UNCCL13]SFQ91337.1 Protein of unknown function [Bacillus sp. cl95]
MKRYSFMMMAVMFLIGLTGSVSYAAPNTADCQETLKVQLTDKQKTELDVLYRATFAKKKQIVDKYVEFGAITKEMGDKKKQWLDKKYEKLVANGYVPHKCHYKHRMHKAQNGQ